VVVETKVKVGGLWRIIGAPEVKYSGSWRAIQTIQVKKAGVWETVFEIAGSPLNATNTIVQSEVFSGAVHSGVYFNSDGTMDEVGPGLTDLTFLGLDQVGNDHTGEWYDDSPTGSQWEIRCASMVSGTWSGQAASVGIWIDLSGNRLWRVTRLAGKTYTPGTIVAIGNMEIREVADIGNIVTFTLRAEAIQS